MCHGPSRTPVPTNCNLPYENEPKADGFFQRCVPLARNVMCPWGVMFALQVMCASRVRKRTDHASGTKRISKALTPAFRRRSKKYTGSSGRKSPTEVEISHTAGSKSRETHSVLTRPSAIS